VTLHWFDLAQYFSCAKTMSNFVSAGNVSVGGTMNVSGVSTLSQALNIAANIVQTGASSVTTGTSGVITNLFSYASGTVSFFQNNVTAILMGGTSSTCVMGGAATVATTLNVGTSIQSSILKTLVIDSATPASALTLFTNAANSLTIGASGYGTTLNSNALTLPTGRLVMTAAPAVSVYLGTNITLNAATYTKCVFDTVVYQDGGTNYSTTTGLFTVPANWAGHYMVTGSLNLQAATSLTNSFAVVYKNGTYYRKGSQLGSGVSPNGMGQTFCICAKLAVGDTIAAYAYYNSIVGAASIYNGGGVQDTWLTVTFLHG